VSYQTFNWAHTPHYFYGCACKSRTTRLFPTGIAVGRGVKRYHAESALLQLWNEGKELRGFAAPTVKEQYSPLRLVLLTGGPAIEGYPFLRILGAWL
jgi:hypothetical protein